LKNIGKEQYINSYQNILAMIGTIDEYIAYYFQRYMVYD